MSIDGLVVCTVSAIAVIFVITDFVLFNNWRKKIKGVDIIVI
jgi:hypothetical protein